MGCIEDLWSFVASGCLLWDQSGLGWGLRSHCRVQPAAVVFSGQHHPNGAGSLTDPGSGSPILTIDLDSATINSLPGVICGSFNGISLTYAGSMGEINGDWNVTKNFNPDGTGAVTIPLLVPPTSTLMEPLVFQTRSD